MYMTLPYDLVSMQRHTIRNASARGAVCNDGTPGTFYFRDCPRPASECKGWASDWLVVFAGGDSADACYDRATCAARSPNTTSSANYNASLLSPAGIFSYSGEENPNFYGLRTVLVPYCSSDMWLGNTSTDELSFRGLAIATAVLQDLASITFSPTPVPTAFGPGPSNTRLDQADSITLVGGVGLVSALTGSDGGHLATFVPTRPRQRLKVVCDGCALVPVAPYRSVVAQPCTSAADCPPASVLQRGLAVWRSHAPTPTTMPSIDWRDLLADRLLPAVALPMLTQQPQFDETQLKANRAWPLSKANAAYIDAYGAAVRATMYARPHAGRFSFSAACSPAQPDLLRDQNGFFCRPVSCVLQGQNRSTALHLSAAMSMFLKDPEFAPTCVDGCGALDCNAHCKKPSCWGRSE